MSRQKLSFGSSMGSSLNLWPGCSYVWRIVGLLSVESSVLSNSNSREISVFNRIFFPTVLSIIIVFLHRYRAMLSFQSDKMMIIKLTVDV